jgi:hypothetical protein
MTYLLRMLPYPNTPVDNLLQRKRLLEDKQVEMPAEVKPYMG